MINDIELRQQVHALLNSMHEMRRVIRSDKVIRCPVIKKLNDMQKALHGVVLRLDKLFGSK
jgi:hypothetical protein